MQINVKRLNSKLTNCVGENNVACREQWLSPAADILSCIWWYQNKSRVLFAPPFLNVQDVFRQTHVERLWEQEDQAATRNPRPSKDQGRQAKPNVLQQHDHWSQGAPKSTDTGGVAQTALPVQQQAGVFTFI